MQVIRPIQEDDKPAWRNLWLQYLEFYKTELSDAVTGQLFRRLIGEGGHFCLVAEREGQIIGFVHALTHASTWSIDDYCYLEDLFVDPSVRGKGTGRLLIEEVYKEADRRGCSRVYWHTDDDNTSARKLYDNVASLTNFVQYRR